MRNLPPAVAAHLASGGGIDVQVLIWLVARDRETAAPAPIGLWTGADHQVITVDGEARTYFGVGALLDVEPFNSIATAQERTWSFSVSPLHAQIVEAVRVYEARLASVEAHEWRIDPLTNTALAPPIRAFRGTVLEINMPIPALGQDSVATISSVSDAWRLTRGLTLTRSQSALSARAEGDDIRKYNDLVGIETAWGEKTKGGDGGGKGDGGSWGAA